MAVLPLKQLVTIIREGETDEWGNGDAPIEFVKKCRIDEGAKIVASAQTADEVTSSASILFDKLLEIRMTDVIIYVDDNGISRTYRPIAVNVIRGLNGKAMLTEVNV